MRTLLVVNATHDPSAGVVNAGQAPRRDYTVLQQRLGATILDRSALDLYWWSRLLRRIVGVGPAQAVLARRWSGSYDAVFVDRESAGALLGALSRFRRRSVRLVVVGHLLTTPSKRLVLRLLGLGKTVNTLIVHSVAQQSFARRGLGLRAEQVALLPYHADTHFWTPQGEGLDRRICGAGLEYRDYATLARAVRGLDVAVTIAAASHWSSHHADFGGRPLPGNVRVVSLGYLALRALYAESLFVVVPLREIDNQAGITTILEAMSMGKAVIVSETRGQTDLVRDRRRSRRRAPHRVVGSGWASSFDRRDAGAGRQTGIYVRPGDSAELRRAITFLLRNPEQARGMGANGRDLVVETMQLDHFVERVTLLLQGRQPNPLGEPPRAGTPRDGDEAERRDPP